MEAERADEGTFGVPDRLAGDDSDGNRALSPAELDRTCLGGPAEPGLEPTVGATGLDRAWT